MNTTAVTSVISKAVDEVDRFSSTTPTKVSFGVRKRPEATVQSVNKLRDSSRESDDETEQSEPKKRRISHLENGEFPKSEDDRSKKADSKIIQVATKNEWAYNNILRLKETGKLTDEDVAKLEQSYPDLEARLNNEIGQKYPSEDFGVDADYAAVPVEGYGLAVLRGCGWSDGEGIGNTNKQVVNYKPIQQRPKGLGLGAYPSMNSDDEATKKEEADAYFPERSFVRIAGGYYRNSFGVVISTDEDNCSVIVQLENSKRIIRVSKFSVASAKREESAEQNCLMGEEYEALRDKVKKELQKDKKTSYGLGCSGLRTGSFGIERDEKVKIERGEGEEDEDDCRWVHTGLKVRFVNKEFKGGQLYLKKLLVTAALNSENCTLFDEETGKTYYEIPEEWLETFVPKLEGATLLIVHGRWTGKKAILMERRKKEGLVIARIISSGIRVQREFDEVCEYVGHPKNHRN